MYRPGISEFHWRLDSARRSLPRIFALVVAVFVLIQFLGYLSRFEIRLVERDDADPDTVLMEYEYVDEQDGDSRSGSQYDYAAMESLAQEQAQYNYRYRYKMAKYARDKTAAGARQAPLRKTNILPDVSRVCNMRERREHMRAYCSRDKTIDDTFQHKDLLVDETHRTLYCSIPRVASTSWRTVMAKATGNLPLNVTWPPVHNKGFLQGLGLKFLSDYDKPDANRIAKEYFKVIVVRHPFDRLVSAWRDLLVVRNSPSRWKLGSAILAEYRDETHYETSQEWNDTARFHEFARYITDKDVHNVMWEPYSSACDVCMYKWDAILKLETGYNDSSVFLSKFPNYVGGLPVLHSHSNDQQQTETPQIQKRVPQFEKVPKATLDQLKYLYEADFEIFGYDWIAERNKTRCAIRSEHGEWCC